MSNRRYWNVNLQIVTSSALTGEERRASLARLVGSLEPHAVIVTFADRLYDIRFRVPGHSALTALSSASQIWDDAAAFAELPSWMIVRAEVATDSDAS